MSVFTLGFDTGEWVVMKASRSKEDNEATPVDGYTGPATKQAGVEPGRVYPDRDAALSDARKLSDVNPVGFHAVKLAPVELRIHVVGVDPIDYEILTEVDVDLWSDTKWRRLDIQVERAEMRRG